MSSYLLAVIGGLGGAIVGFLIGRFFESRTFGACPILCNPRISTVFFAALGIILAVGGK